MKKVLVGFVLFVAVIVGLSLYVGITAGGRLLSARSALASAEDVTAHELAEAKDDFAAAARSFDSLPAQILKAVPVVRQNVVAVETAVDNAPSVLEAGLVLKQRIDILDDRGVLVDGRVRTRAIRALEVPLARTSQALREAGDALARSRNGWLLPPVWSAVDRGIEEAAHLAELAGGGARLAALSDALLGAGSPRRYLIVLMNNAELRGAGGIPSAVGTLTVDNGRLKLGRFVHTFSLRGARPFHRVDAPEDFARRFGHHGADTTLWVNTTMSPDVPDVAAVASRLFEHSTGVATDGVIFVDPIGIAALLPEGAEVSVPGTAERLSRADLPRYVFSEAYEQLGGQSEGRRDALIGLGRNAFALAIESGLRSRAELEDAGRAVTAGHIRVVSFDDDEAALLSELNATGDLSAPAVDSAMAVIQNYGSGKLDYWMRNRIAHTCEIDPASARCELELTMVNTAPEGLPSYVAGHPYGVNDSRVELYVPFDARLDTVEVDGEPAQFFPDEQDGHRVVGVDVRISREEQRSVAVVYEVPLRDGYELIVRPQPLARAAQLSLALEIPSGWGVRGPGDVEDGVLRYEVTLDHTLEIAISPSERTGLPAAWNRVVSFLRDPLF